MRLDFTLKSGKIVTKISPFLFSECTDLTILADLSFRIEKLSFVS